MKPAAKIFAFTSIFIVGFLFFLVLTFDYGVLKEALSAQVSQQTGQNITIGAMRPSLPIGVTLDDFLLQSDASQRLEFKKIRMKVSILSLLIGRLGLFAELSAANGGKLETYCSLSLLDLIKGQDPIPNHVELHASSFPLENSISFILKHLASSPATNPLLSPILKEINFITDFDANIDLSLNAKDPGQSTGVIEARFKKAKLMLNTPSLALPDQDFEKAEIIAKIDAGTLKFADNSGFHSKDLDLSINGSIKFGAPLSNTGLKMRMGIKFMEQLRESLGFILGAFSGGGDSGQMTVEINGTIANPQVQTM